MTVTKNPATPVSFQPARAVMPETLKVADNPVVGLWIHLIKLQAVVINAMPTAVRWYRFQVSEQVRPPAMLSLLPTTAFLPADLMPAMVGLLLLPVNIPVIINAMFASLTPAQPATNLAYPALLIAAQKPPTVGPSPLLISLTVMTPAVCVLN